MGEAHERFRTASTDSSSRSKDSSFTEPRFCVSLFLSQGLPQTRRTTNDHLNWAGLLGQNGLQQADNRWDWMQLLL